MGNELTAQAVRAALFYEPSTGEFVWLSGRRACGANSRAGSVDRQGYVRIKLNGRKYRAHRLAWLYMTGSWPSEEIDHIDLVKNNNSWNNLRIASRSQNEANKKKIFGSCNYKGVSKRKSGMYLAQIQRNGIKMHLGCFDSPEAAHSAYVNAAKELFKDFARAS